MLQNRVDPFGALWAVPQRGAWFGNKGCLHDEAGRVVRPHQGKRWITCVCAFRGRKRKLLQPRRYTELFFHDEATAYAAGHRPCAQCRYADWQRFSALWAQVSGPLSADEMDAILHHARLDGRNRRLTRIAASQVPVGAMIVHDAKPVLRGTAGWWHWRFDGYTPASPATGQVEMLTPHPLAALMVAGLPVQMAPPAS